MRGRPFVMPVSEGLLPDFKLQTLARRLSGRRRIADPPGSEIP